MTTPVRLRAASLVTGLALVAATGCSSGERRASSGAQLPPAGGGTTPSTGRRTPGQGTGLRTQAPGSAAGTAADAEGTLPGALDAAIHDLARRIAERHAAGWPPTVPLSSEPRPRPVIRIADVVNDTALRIDVEALTARVRHALLAQGLLAVAPSREEQEAELDRRAEALAGGDDHDDAGVDGEEAAPLPDAVGLLLRGEISADIAEVGGVRRRRTTLTFRVLDASEGKAVLRSETELRQDPADRR